MKCLTVTRLRTATVYALVFKGLVFGLVPLFALLGVLASVDMFDMAWNGQAVTGIKAILVGPVIGLLSAVLGTAFTGSVIAFGLWVHGFWRPLTLEYRALADKGDE